MGTWGVSRQSRPASRRAKWRGRLQSQEHPFCVRDQLLEENEQVSISMDGPGSMSSYFCDLIHFKAV